MSQQKTVSCKFAINVVFQSRESKYTLTDQFYRREAAIHPSVGVKAGRTKRALRAVCGW